MGDAEHGGFSCGEPARSSAEPGQFQGRLAGQARAHADERLPYGLSDGSTWLAWDSAGTVRIADFAIASVVRQV
jgi:hypothetical protein